MNIVAWNCRQAFRKKVGKLVPFCPKIAVISECESLEKLAGSHESLFAHSLWVGDNPHKGLGVFSSSEHPLTVHPAYDDRFHWIVPIRVTGSESFTLLAVWTKDHKDRKQSYVGQLFLALQEYQSILKEETCLVVGDLNSNAIWDSLPRVGNHTAVVKILQEHGLASAYHWFFREEHGMESVPTYYFHHHREKGYHIDYGFLPVGWMERVESVSVGTYEEWREWSDHVPVVIKVGRGDHLYFRTL
ncbi:endonuclease/exonuclease/phosphatase family protein [Brevibacillus choshinensis]|uniref:endonuclease/exonuclease/phosphatase family protein n=1 Tax=Brevibacillus choshinensis TaxID=54911 RepID=UPI002E1B43C7|nr:endonuclease/exonuclease/phosphatase family protein [Brevibacillus choshinensis]